MKKIIALLSASAMALSMVVTASAAASTPKFEVTCTEINEFTGDYASYTDFDWSEYEEGDLDYKSYLVEVFYTGTEFGGTVSTVSKKKKLTGTAIVGVDLFLSSDVEDAAYDQGTCGNNDFTYGYVDSPFIVAPEMGGGDDKNMHALAKQSATALYPAETAAGTFNYSASDKTLVAKYVITVDASKTVEFTLNGNMYIGVIDASVLMGDPTKYVCTPAVFTLPQTTGLPESGTTVVSETTLDSSDTQAIDNTNTYPATVGSAKILKNYAIDKVTFAPAKGSLGKYYLKATDDQGKTKVWKMFTADSNPDATDETHDGFTDHKGGKIETQIKNGEITEASFYIMIRSANHKIAKYEVYTAE